MPQAFLKALAPFTVLQIAATVTYLMMKGVHHEEVSYYRSVPDRTGNSCNSRC